MLCLSRVYNAGLGIIFRLAVELLTSHETRSEYTTVNYEKRIMLDERFVQQNSIDITLMTFAIKSAVCFTAQFRLDVFCRVGPIYSSLSQYPR